MLREVKKIFKTGRLKKFIIVGASAAIVNFGAMIIFVEILDFNEYFYKNIANILSIELSIIFNFYLSRQWTWFDAPQKKGKMLVGQLLYFNLAALTGIFMRIICFAALDRLEVFYIINVAIGIGIAAIVDFILYDKLIFRRSTNEKLQI